MKASNATSSRKAQPRVEQPRNAGSSSNTAERFTLSGPSIILDERIHAYRRDIADIALAGQLFAPHYARPMIRSCGARPAFIYYKPAAEKPIGSELLPGEEFAVLEISGGWAWGYSRHDHYVGYVEAISLIEAPPATHVVAALEAHILPEPNVNVPALAKLPMGSRVTGHEQSGFLATDVGYIAFTEVRELDSFEHDPVSVAARYIGSPYLMGGRTPQGIDCSGLVQVAHALCGIPTPRDSDQQRILGRPVKEPEGAIRGDLIFFEGHVGLMADGTNLLHATGRRGTVVLEPLAEVEERTAIQERRRLA